MANQPTKYRKFVVGAASAALVASAVAPVAFAAEFTDVKDNNSHKVAIDALSEAGVITGYQDGTFQPNKTLTRSDVVKLMGKWLIAEGYDVPTDYKTKPRFADLKTTSNDELLKMSALVYDNGLFVGKVDGTLDPAGDITRENMAIVLVRAFDRVHDIDLVSYVEAQEFDKDVTDLGKAKAEARPAIDVLDFFDITNPAAPEFNPKNTTTRAQFASFLYKTTLVDFDKIGGGIVAPDVDSVTAINSTTVEVKMKEKVENINSLKFTIDGLTVSNAAVKQSDDKTVVLTTAVQKGGEKYTVKLDGKAIGSFNGVSPTVPSKINLNTTSVQGVVGQQVILSADTGVKEAGIPVTFNVSAAGNTLNKDQVFEVVTNADGIATFSYTQYNAGKDTVTVYPTGKADVREQGTVYWANAAQLTITDSTEGSLLANGSKKVYEINSKKNAGKVVFVGFKENLNVAPDQLVKTVNAEGVATYELNTNGIPTSASNYPYKASTSGEAVIAVPLDANGKANLVLTGTNAAVTPIVYEGTYNPTAANTAADQMDPKNYNASFDKTALQATGSTVTFSVQHALGLTIKAEGVQNAAVANEFGTGGRDYVVNYTDKDGKPAAKGTTVRVAIPRVGLSATSDFKVLDSKGNELAQAAPSSATNFYYNVPLEDAGKATFTVTSKGNNDYVTPTVFIENGSVDGLDKNDLQTQAVVTYFVNSVQYAAELSAVNAAGKEINSLNTGETAEFNYELVDQNGKERKADKATEVTFGVTAGVGKILVDGKTYEPGQNGVATVTIAPGKSEATLKVEGVEASSATVTATGSKAGIVIPTTVPASKTVTFVSSSVVPSVYTGIVQSLDASKEEVKFDGKDAVSYETATFKNENGNAISKKQFEDTIVANLGSATVTYTKVGDAVTFEIVKVTNVPTPEVPTELTANTVVEQTVAVGAEKVLLTNVLATSNKDITIVSVTDGGTVANAEVKNNELVITGKAVGNVEVTVTVKAGDKTADVKVPVKVSEANAVVKFDTIGASSKIAPNATFENVVSFLESELAADLKGDSYSLVIGDAVYEFRQSSLNADRYLVAIAMDEATVDQINAGTFKTTK
ncbi:hypothetical protein CSV61_08535 [Sporosarcina sp. P3]|uniref:S-layer homology domain-containing protein n=1 Tax=Sporosarcina sp. P3 TaxID=2048245 RepID=UPI000C168DC4|nr:S-layer homology domain-containing protein [Sporosarcina sp. P3]PID21737.1 hypothetical protein CSV61_08535 [Sporosarcina sp. P3]